MNIYNKLIFFQELIECTYTVYLWSYSPDLTLLHTNCPPRLLTRDAVSILNFADSLLAYVNKRGRYPFILDTSLGLLWIASFEYNDSGLDKIYLLGPAFTGKNSHLMIKDDMNRRNLSVKLRSKIFRQIDEIPIIPSTTLFQYATMMHYCITGERITSADIQFPQNEAGSTADDIRFISEEHRGIWIVEQNLLNMIREGNPDYITALERSQSLSYGVKLETGDSMRQQKNSVHVLLTLCSRAAIEGGLNPSISYTLSDYYSQQIEDSKATSDLTKISFRLLEDYVARVRQSKADTCISKQILNICDYINMHISEKLTIERLAKHIGYTEYYFSYKFNKEMGMSVNEYIYRKKVEQAKLLLTTSKISIQDISTELSFGSRSYFSTAFHKYTGVSPREYRDKNIKL